MNEKREPAGSLFFLMVDLQPLQGKENQYSFVSLSSSASEKTGPSLQTYFSPTLQCSHFPIPHFIRVASEVMMLDDSWNFTTKRICVKLPPGFSVRAISLRTD
ncbi:MAG: hypothetical protein ACYDAA_18845 [Syntrophales bacterium]